MTDNKEPRSTGARAVSRALVDNGVTDLFGIHGHIAPVLEETGRLGVKHIYFHTSSLPVSPQTPMGG